MASAAPWNVRAATPGHAEGRQALLHHARGLVGERDRENLGGQKRAALDLLRDPPRDGGRLPRSRAREDAHRPADGLRGAPLGGIEALEDVHAATLTAAAAGA